MKTSNKLNLIKSSISALFTAVICITAQLSILTPAGVPLTLQTLVIAVCGYFLGLKWGTASVITYILLGAVGIPVFSGLRGGFQHIVSASGGFIIGFILLSLACGFSACKPKRQQILYGTIGLILCHLCGIIQLKLVSGISLMQAFLTGSLPFILKDLICVVLGIYFAEKLKNKIKI